MYAFEEKKEGDDDDGDDEKGKDGGEENEDFIEYTSTMTKIMMSKIISLILRNKVLYCESSHYA